MKWSNKTILVTGGAGFIGSALSRRLIQLNANVIVVDNLSTGKRHNVPKTCEFIKCDVEDIKTINSKDVDYIYHFGAPCSIVLFDKNPYKCVETTITGFNSVFRFAVQRGVKKVIYPSSSTIYGYAQIPHSERSIPQPTNLYGISKIACENIARAYSSVIPSVGLRIFAGYGPGENHKKEVASVITLFLTSILRDRRPIVYGNGAQSRDFVYIDDIVKAILNAAKDHVTGIINVGSGRAFTFNEVISMLCSVFDRNIKPRYLQAPKNYFPRTLADIKRMRKLLGIVPISLEEGIKRYVACLHLNKGQENLYISR